VSAEEAPGGISIEIWQLNVSNTVRQGTLRDIKGRQVRITSTMMQELSWPKQQRAVFRWHLDDVGCTGDAFQSRSDITDKNFTHPPDPMPMTSQVCHRLARSWASSASDES
jgi:hypothetical protein